MMFGGLFLIVCIVMMVWMMSHHTSRGPWTGDWRANGTDAERILAERLARGEIDTEEYQRRLTTIRQGRETEQS